MKPKTREELFAEIDRKQEEINALKEDIKKLERYKQYNEMAGEIKAVYDGYVQSGFTEKQAFELTKISMTFSK